MPVRWHFCCGRCGDITLDRGDKKWMCKCEGSYVVVKDSRARMYGFCFTTLIDPENQNEEKLKYLEHAVY